jgi:hypothetical protein
LLKHIAAVAFIFLCSTAAWLVLAASISVRTNNSDDKLRPGIASTWGAPHQQMQPTAALEDPAAAQPKTPLPSI